MIVSSLSIRNIRLVRRSNVPRSATDKPRPCQATPQKQLTLFDSTSIIVGIMIGSSIFLSTPLVAQMVPSVGWLVGVWVIGAGLTLVGALCYAELATAYPKEGGDYVFLTQAFGRKIGFVFAWAQFWIVRPGSVGTLAFVFAEYANQLCPLKEELHPLLIYAVGAVVVLSGMNLLGVRAGKWTQNLLTVMKFLGLLAIVVVGMTSTAVAPVVSQHETSLNLGLAMIFVFFAYSGWNEMAYVSAEVRNPQRNILYALILGTLAVAAIYLALNLSFVHALGFAGLQASNAVATDVLSLGIGRWAGSCISLLICIAALGGINGMIFTGARILYAMGTEHRLYSWLGQWNSQTDAPARPLIIQAAATVALTLGFGWQQEGLDGFQASVVFTSPSFWFFLCMVGVSLFVLRARQAGPQPTYRVPLYPLVPLAFCLSSAYMFVKSLEYAATHTPYGLIASAVILGIGAVLSFVG
jgi:basic amino acid/polyamine antiporter, APA family